MADGIYQNLMTNPMFQTGLGLLSQAGPSATNASFGQRMSAGVGQGLQGMLAMRQDERRQALTENNRKRQELDQKIFEQKQEREAGKQAIMSQLGETEVGPFADRYATGEQVSMEDISQRLFKGGYGKEASTAVGMIPDAPTGPGEHKLGDVRKYMTGEGTEVAETYMGGGQWDELGRGTKSPLVTVETPKPTSEFVKSMEKKAATVYTEWTMEGGAAKMARNLEQLDFVQRQLESGQNLTGPIIGNVPDWLLAFGKPESLSAKEAAQDVAQQSLKLILGGQFGEKEGDRLINRAFNPRLSEEENIRRIKVTMRFSRRVAAAKQAQAEYAEEHLTMLGYKGPAMPKILELDQSYSKGTGKEQESEKPKSIDELLEMY